MNSLRPMTSWATSPLLCMSLGDDVAGNDKMLQLDYDEHGKPCIYLQCYEAGILSYKGLSFAIEDWYEFTILFDQIAELIEEIRGGDNMAGLYAAVGDSYSVTVEPEFKQVAIDYYVCCSDGEKINTGLGVSLTFEDFDKLKRVDVPTLLTSAKPAHATQEEMQSCRFCKLQLMYGRAF